MLRKITVTLCAAVWAFAPTVSALAVPQGQGSPGFAVPFADGNGGISRPETSRWADLVYSSNFSTLAAAVSAAAAKGAALAITAGTYDASGVSFSVPVAIQPGATLNCATGQATFSKSLLAGRYQIFGSSCAPLIEGSQDSIVPEWWGADATGSGDYAIGLNAAINSANASGGGQVSVVGIGQTLKLSQTVTLRSNVQVECYGRPTLKLNSGVNDTVLEGVNFKSLVGTNSATVGISNFLVRDCVFDGNTANNLSPTSNGGHGVAFVGRDFLLENVTVQNVTGSCFWTEYASQGGGTSPYNGRVAHIVGNTCGSHGWYNNVSDLHADDVNIRDAGYNQTAGSSTASGIFLDSHGCVRGTNINVWISVGSAQYSLLADGSGCEIVNVHLESGYSADLAIVGSANRFTNVYAYNNAGGAGTTALAIYGNNNFVSGELSPSTYGNAAANGLVLGGTFNSTAYTPTGTVLDLHITGYTGYLVDWTHDGGLTIANLYTYQPSGTAFAWYPAAGDYVTAMGTVQMYGGLHPNSVQLGANAQANQAQCTAVGYWAECDDYNSVSFGAFGRASQRGHIDFSTDEFAARGDSDWKLVHWMNTTTNATATQLFLDKVSQTAAPQTNASWSGDFDIVGRRTDSVHTIACWYRVTGFSVSNNGTTLSIDSAGTTTAAIAGSCSAPTLSVSGTSLLVTVTGVASNTIRWTAYGKFIQAGG